MAKTFIIDLENLDCADCALELTDVIKRIKGVIDCDVSFITQTVQVKLDNIATLDDVIEGIEHFEDVQVKNQKKHLSYQIIGLDCVNCAKELEEIIDGMENVISVKVLFVSQKIEIDCLSNCDIAKLECVINSFEEVRIVEKFSHISYLISGLDCANCALELEEIINKEPGIKNCTVDFINKRIAFDYLNQQSLQNAKDLINSFEDVKIVDNRPKRKQSLSLWLIIISSIAFIITLISSLIVSHYSEEAQEWISIIGFAISYVVVGWPVIIKTVKNIKNGRIFDENFLMTMAAIGAIVITVFTADNEMLEAAAVMLLYQIGEFLQAKAVGSSRKTIENLVELKNVMANKVLEDGSVAVVSPERLEVDDVIMIKLGERVPVDATIIEGSSSFDTKSLTGESMPINREIGEELLAGYVNLGAVIKAKVKHLYVDSAVAKILDLVENCAAKKAKPEQFITRFARYYTPIVCLIAFLLAIIGPFVEWLVIDQWQWSTWLIKAITVLVISCPCALVISVPLTYFGGIGACAKRGILVKGATNLDELSHVDMAIFDKTGTLTFGEFKIVEAYGEDVDELLKLSASLEKWSNHPISQAFDLQKAIYQIDDVKEMAGYGLSGRYNGQELLLGNYKLMEANHIEVAKINSSDTVLYCALAGKYFGAILVGDLPRPNVSEVINQLKHLGVKRFILLTGDNQKRAADFANKYPIDDIYSELLPQDKVEIATKIAENNRVLYIGDGINDAPVMSAVNCAFSMGKLGSDAAVEASDFVLVEDDLAGLVKAKRISIKTRYIVFENIIGSILVKVIVLVLGAFSLIPLWAAVLADVGIMLLAVFNSLRVKR